MRTSKVSSILVLRLNTINFRVHKAGMMTTRKLTKRTCKFHQQKLQRKLAEENLNLNFITKKNGIMLSAGKRLA